jgi:sterol desaturase/sphingolipid hydroxylase (fatty acid hydroxylase superfamily)
MVMLPYLMSIARVCIWLAILVAIFVPLEQFFAQHPKKILRKGIGVDLCYYFLSSLLPTILLSAPLGALAWIVHTTIPESFLAAVAALPLWVRLLAGLVAGDIGYYWGHRLSHTVPFLWRFHAIHHSAEHVDFLVNTRAHPVDLVFGKFCGLIPIYLLGLAGPVAPADSLVPILLGLFGMVWGFFIHADLHLRFGPLEWLITTPLFHHWHHTLSGPINRNYSATLPWLDRLFGTHHLPNEWPSAYGVEDKLPDSLAGQLMYPLDPPAPPSPSSSVSAAPREPMIAEPDAATPETQAVPET